MPVQSILDPVDMPRNVKADAFDAYHAATDAADLQKRLDKLPLPNKVKADLWDSKNAESSQAGEAYQEPKTLGGFGMNVLTSGGNLISNIGHAVMHPMDTEDAILKTAIGGANKVRTMLGATPPKTPSEEDQAFSAFTDNLKQRYGSVDKLVDTAYKDPVGVLADLSAVAGGVSGAARGVGLAADAAKAGTVANVARTVAKTAANVSDLTNPVALVAKPVAAGVDAAGGSVATHLYKSALKPAKTNTLEAINQMVDTGLKEGINPGSVKSLDKVRGLLSDVRNTIQQGIDDRTAMGATVDPNAVARRVDDMRGRFQSVDPAKDLASIDATKQRFLDQFTPPATPTPQPSGLLGPNGQPIPATPPAPAPVPQRIPLDQAQAMKTNTNAIISPKMGELSTATVEAQKALVRGLKEEIEGIFPEIKAMNAREGALMGLEPAVEAAIKRIGNKDLIPVGDSVRSTVAKILDNPSVKAKIAIGLEKAPHLSKGVTVGGRLGVVTDRIHQYLSGIDSAELAGQTQ